MHLVSFRNRSACVKENGYPDLFIVVFEAKEFDRAKTWIRHHFPTAKNRCLALHEKGFRVRFTNGLAHGITTFDPKNTSKQIISTKLRPFDFDAKMTKEQLEERFGKPEKMRRRSFAVSIEVYRYLTPGKGVKSFTFIDNQLSGVMAGFAWVPRDAHISRATSRFISSWDGAKCSSF